jgi:hypothetical protein
MLIVEDDDVLLSISWKPVVTKLSRAPTVEG